MSASSRFFVQIHQEKEGLRVFCPICGSVIKRGELLWIISWDGAPFVLVEKSPVLCCGLPKKSVRFAESIDSAKLVADLILWYYDEHHAITPFPVLPAFSFMPAVPGFGY